MKRLLLAFIIVGCTVPAFAQQDPVVYRVVPDAAAGTAIVYGRSFGLRPTVQIAGVAVTVRSTSPTQLVVDLPVVATERGSYILKVIRANGQSDLFAFTVGATGPKGDRGADAVPGPPGAPGIGGPRGDKGDPGEARLPDPPCADSANRYVDCGNGTITDTLTGLVWLQQADCLPQATWADAQEAAFALKDGDCNLTDGSGPGDWRAATEAEWAATMRTTCVSDGPGPPALSNTEGTECFADGPSSFTGVMAHPVYWTGTSDFVLSRGRRTDLESGFITSMSKDSVAGVWPVRRGSR